MKIISVDIALRKSGVVVVDSVSGELKFNTTLNVSTKLSRIEALLSIYSFFHKFFSDEIEKNTECLLVMEDVMTFGHLKAAVAIESARTCATLAYHHVTGRMSVCPYMIYATPGTVKHFYTGKRGAKKPELFLKFLTSHPEYAHHVLNEDEMDALVLGVYGKETFVAP